MMSHGLAIVALMFVTFPGGQPERPLYVQFIPPQEQKILCTTICAIKCRMWLRSRQAGTPRNRAGPNCPNRQLSPPHRNRSQSRYSLQCRRPSSTSRETCRRHSWWQSSKLLFHPARSAEAEEICSPPPVEHEPKLPMQTPMLETQAPALNSAAVNAPIVPSTLAISEFTDRPPKPAPVAPDANKGNAKADIAIASLHPTEETKVRVPDGQLPAQFSKAPTQGAAASGTSVAT